MWTVLCALALAEPPVAAERWRDQPIDPRGNPDGTAFTVPKKHWKLGLANQDYGLLKNLSIGTSAPLFAVGVLNAHAKVTAIQTPRFDAALQAGWYTVSLAAIDVPDGRVTVTPVGWVGSWTPFEKLGVHFGTHWTLARATGTLTAADIGEGIAAATGADMTKDLVAALGEDGGAYAGANVSILKTHLMLEYRFNRRDSIVLLSDAYVHLSGLVAAGVAAESDQADVEVGASARLSMPLKESLPALTALSWQWSWRRFHLRVGVPLPLTNTFAWLNAVDAYWILGPSRRRDG